MNEWTDKQFKDAGWKWLLRYNSEPMACTKSPNDAVRWLEEKLGEVINLQNI